MTDLTRRQAITALASSTALPWLSACADSPAPTPTSAATEAA